MSVEDEFGDLAERFLAAEETVAKMSRGETRAFAVTDRRVLDVRSGMTADGKPIEEVESTLFTDVAGVDLRIEESVTEVDLLRRVLGALSGLLGLLVLLFGIAADLGDANGLVMVVGVFAIGLGIWLWLTAEETRPGGIRITFRYPAGSETAFDRYRLPESQQGTARAAIRMVGSVHDPGA